MAELKTKPTGASVAGFLDAIPDPVLRQDCWTITGIMKAAAKAEPEMWGPSIVGFGRRGDWMLIAFSPRKKDITLYILNGREHPAELLSKLGAHSAKGGCLHIKKLSDVHLPALKKLVSLYVKAHQP